MGKKKESSDIVKTLTRLFNTLTEPSRSVAEYNAAKPVLDEMEKKMPDGDGHPVLILPGFFTNDFVTTTLRDILTRKGFKAHGWDGGFNLGLNERTATHLKEQLHRVFEENGGQKVSLVGHSLGGIYARELAREYPEMVRCVVTLGSPFGALDKPDTTPERLKKTYQWINPDSAHFLDDPEMAERSLTPPPVPTTSVFSKTDVVVHWTASINPDLPHTENIEVSCSHLGMVWNPGAIAVVLDRLTQDPANWQPFVPHDDHAHHYHDTITPADKPQNPGWHQDKSDKKPFFKK